MQLINSPDALFHDGNPATGVIGTPLAAAWHNAVQGEVAAPILAAGMALDPNNNAQLLAAILALIEARSGNYLLDTGAANACVVAMNPALTAYANGLPVKFRIAHNITGGSTLNAGPGAVPLLRDDGSPTQNGDAPGGSILSATFDAAANGFLINSIVPSQIATQVAAILATGVQSLGKLNGVNSPNEVFNGSGEFGGAGWSLTSSFAAQNDTLGGVGTYFTNLNALAANSGSIGSPQVLFGPNNAIASCINVSNAATAGTLTVALAAFNSIGGFIGNIASVVVPNGTGMNPYQLTGSTPAGTQYVLASVNLTGVTCAASGIVFERLKIEKGNACSLYSQEASIATLGFAHGQCRLSVASPTSLQLSPYNGNGLIINGVPQQIPAAGVTVTNAGLIASAWYYVYAYMNGATMAMECSSTGYVTAANGVKVKSSDATRTLVGAIYTSLSGPNFADTTVQRFCLSHFNRQNKYLAVGQSNISFTNTAMAEISASLRASFISWADESVQASASGEISTNAGSISITYQQAIDGAAGQLGDFTGTWFTSGGVGNCFASNNGAQVTEGVLHYLTILGAVNSGTGTVLQGYTRGMIRG